MRHWRTSLLSASPAFAIRGLVRRSRLSPREPGKGPRDCNSSCYPQPREGCASGDLNGSQEQDQRAYRATRQRHNGNAHSAACPEAATPAGLESQPAELGAEEQDG